VKWTKADRRRVWSAVSTWELCHSPPPAAYGAPNRVTCPEGREVEAAAWGLSTLIALGEERADKNEAFVEHLKTHPEVYRDSTPELIDRFTKLARDDRRGVKRLRALIERLKAEGMPPRIDLC